MIADKQDAIGRLLLVATAAAIVAVLASACGPASGATDPTRPGTIGVVAAENEYGSVAAQVGGRYVTVTSIETNPNTDPHDYELSPSVAGAISGADIAIQNGLGYDDFMTRVEAASPNSSRLVIDVQHLLGLPDSTPNPHLWYSPRTMPRVAVALAGDLSRFQPRHAAYFRHQASAFVASLGTWLRAIAAFKGAHGGAFVAVTEPVCDDLLQALGLRIATPFSLQADVMNGVDPAPQDVAIESALLSQRRVQVFVYNEQVTDPLTEGFLATAHSAGVKVVGVDETMPPAASTYQTWMLDTVRAIDRALAGS